MAYRYTQKILFKYCDPAGIVFFPRYFELINDCIESYFADELGLPFEELMSSAGVPTAQIEARFVAPSRHGDLLVLLVEPQRIGRTSLTLAISARCGEELRFDATSTLVYVDRSGRPQRWPEALRAHITAQMGADT